INCNGLTPIVGATGSSYTPTVTGQYAVVVTQNGCSDTSVCQLVQVIATFEPLAESSWNVQPNPAHQQAAVVFKEPLLGQIRLEIYDPAGRLMQKQTVATGTSQADLDLSGLPNGLLLVRLVSAQGTSTKRLMKAEN
ncbi:MAG: T9SS type A sorting domain-containing protein, partial [Saprospiraceae bacterium]